MTGSKGDDRYIVDTQADIVNETGGDGTLDRVMARADYALAADDDIEYLTTVASSDDGHRPDWQRELPEIVGNSGANT